jgi:hypothetical protein
MEKNKNQTTIGGISGPEPIEVLRTPQREFHVGQLVSYERSGKLTEMKFNAKIIGLIVRLVATKLGVSVYLDTSPFRTGDEIRYTAGELFAVYPPKVPNAKVSGLILRLPDGADLTIMPRHAHYEGLRVSGA